MNTMNDTTWKKWSLGDFQVHFIHTGVAESMLHIFPDGTTMLLDCGDHAAVTRGELAVPVVPGPEKLAGEWIARYVKRVLPENTLLRGDLPLIDYMVLSHFHCDHCGTPEWQSRAPFGHPLAGNYRSGFGLAAEQLAFDTAIDRGWPDYNEPTPGIIPPCREFDLMQRLYKTLEQRDGLHVEAFRLGAVNQIALKKNPDAYPDFSIENITVNGKIACRNGKIKNLYKGRVKLPEELNENSMSLGMIIRYGRFSFFTAGDFSDKITDETGATVEIEDILAEELPNVSVAKVNHHGHKSMPAPIIAALAPKAWIAPVWDQLHVLDDVLERLANPSIYPGKRVIFPTVFPDKRVRAAQNQPFLSSIAPETFGNGAHIVMTVPQNADSFRIDCLDPSDESMKLKGTYYFKD